MSVILTYLPYFFPKCMLSNQIIKKASPKAPKITITFLDVVVLVVSNSSFPVDFYIMMNPCTLIFCVLLPKSSESLIRLVESFGSPAWQLQPSFPCTTRRRCCTLILPRPFQQEIFFSNSYYNKFGSQGFSSINGI